ncbi:hypothetical protein PR048_025520 [Dryococelus australis]|uniref:Uncharacterized protein n=1 Tax=Dryococelus australis TaxID=614101 RepID=A0ABQ9GRJ1_9NEOP|nr:hypothetical protein PR048_025520 [Dryococelus australis]
MVKLVPIKWKTNKNSEGRKFTIVYTISGVVICRVTFVQTFRISPQEVNTALQKISYNGGHNNIDEKWVEEVANQINKTPGYKSHYCRNVTNKEFFESHITFGVMYENYKLEVNKPVSMSNHCDSLHVKVQEHENHLKVASDAQTKMKRDMKRAKEKTLPLPRIPTNIVCYKRHLWVYNCGVHSGTTGKVFLFVWVQGYAGSCLKKYIENNFKEGITELVLWADSCGGQKRNIKITLMLKVILEYHPSLTTVYLKFLIPGHTFLPNDAEFSDVEQALKMQQCKYLPDGYKNVLGTCRKKTFFVVILMEVSDFIGCSEMKKNIVNRKVDTTGNKVNWMDIREIILRKDNPFLLYIKTDHNDQAYVTVDLKKKQPGRPSISTFYDLFRKAISRPKLDDLKSMLHLIPSDAKDFYRSLIADKHIVDEIEGFNGPVDFE